MSLGNQSLRCPFLPDCATMHQQEATIPSSCIIIGGQINQGYYSQSVHAYDPIARDWTKVATMEEEGCGTEAAILILAQSLPEC